MGKYVLLKAEIILNTGGGRKIEGLFKSTTPLDIDSFDEIDYISMSGAFYDSITAIPVPIGNKTKKLNIGGGINEF